MMVDLSYFSFTQLCCTVIVAYSPISQEDSNAFTKFTFVTLLLEITVKGKFDVNYTWEEQGFNQKAEKVFRDKTRVSGFQSFEAC